MQKEIFTAEGSVQYWDVVRKGRGEINRLYKSMFKIPLLYGTKKSVLRFLLKDLYGRVLDIGAGSRYVGELCKELSETVEYRSMDTDRSCFHDYYSVDDIQGKFDFIFLLDVIEHLPLNDGISMLMKCKELLNTEGTIIITLPNNLHPTAFSVDCMHVTSYRYNDLGGLVLACGFQDIQIFRISEKRKLKQRILAFLIKPILDFLDLDFATLILIVAKNKE
ncbi:MAG TPA: hypothetical protein DHU69_02135 [Deltaproteobacteria bacterium]|nr:hypothetical protein [Deltaproteobacteria bacterium]